MEPLKIVINQESLSSWHDKFAEETLNLHIKEAFEEDVTVNGKLDN